MIINLSEVKKIYFVGIGGIAMSAAAGLAKAAGFEVSGSDSTEVYAPAKDVLAKFNITYTTGYREKNVSDDPADVYVLSAGEDARNPEVAWLEAQNKTCISFPELLYELAKDDIRTVVTGTHGKSTTAGMLGTLLRDIDDSSFMVGGVLQKENTNFHSGIGHYFVFEGDEYKAKYDDPTPKMHYYKPDIVVLTNAEFDHPDIFQSLDELLGEFGELISHLPDDGLVVYNADDVNLARLVYEDNKRAFSFGIENEANVKLLESHSSDGITHFSIRNAINLENIQTEHYKIALSGKINIYNALACVTTLRALGFLPEIINQYLPQYHGIKRRFEVIATSPITIIDDYAHHPTAVRETLAAAKQTYPGKKIWAVFEPHTFSRTKATLPDLATAFAYADEVLLADIYPARENVKDATITSEKVVAEIKKHHSHVRTVHSKSDAFEILKAEAKPGDVVLIMAVGDFNQLALELR